MPGSWPRATQATDSTPVTAWRPDACRGAVLPASTVARTPNPHKGGMAVSIGPPSAFDKQVNLTDLPRPPSERDKETSSCSGPATAGG